MPDLLKTLTYMVLAMLMVSRGSGAPPPSSPVHELIQTYCLECHNSDKQKGKLNLETLLATDMAAHRDYWEDVSWALYQREMPPEDEPDLARPGEDEYIAAIQWLDEHLAAPHPDETPLGASAAGLAVVDRYCIRCHNADDHEGDMDLESVLSSDIVQHPDIWERVIRRVQSRQMPPPDSKRPSEEMLDDIVSFLAGRLDQAAIERPQPGRTETFRRLNRTEYQNAIRDLLGLHVDAARLLPKDEESHGFDNVTVGTLSPSLLDRYISAARKISRLAIGSSAGQPQGETIRMPADHTQEKHVEGLPLGTRGGALIPFTFPQDGEYDIEVRLTRDRNEHVEGLHEPHDMEILLNRAVVERFTVRRPQGRQDHSQVDQHLTARVAVSAGRHELGVTFIMKPNSLSENRRQPYEAHFNFHRHPRLSPAVYQVSITGPFTPRGASDTPSRERVFTRYPDSPEDQDSAATEILSGLMRRAYRRPVTAADLDQPMAFYQDAAVRDGFEAGIEAALSAILVHPEFLFRIEREPRSAPPGQAYPITDLELANRMSFFLWGSIPDDALLDDAIAGRLRQPETLEAQTRRMIKDPRSANLVNNFAAQWLHLRNLDATTPDLRRFPDFDNNLRIAFRKETELFVESVLREDRSVLDLLRADYTYLNERLARHYGIPHVQGSRFRRVTLSPETMRGGLLRHGSILTVTSYATRTSPVIRGNWILENILGTPARPPPADVPALEENSVDAQLPIRERLAEHRANPACASCHNLMDPVGFALENYDAVGRWRTFEGGVPVDATGGLPDGSTFAGVVRLEDGLVQRPELFVRTFTEKLLTFALGRGIEAHDAPAVRRIVSQARDNDFRISTILIGIMQSVPFQMRTTAADDYAGLPQTDGDLP